MKKLLSLFLLLPFYTWGQPEPTSKETGIYFCCEHIPCIRFVGRAALDRHNCDEHIIGCPDNGNGKNGVGFNFKNPISSGIVGSLVGVLGGSLLEDANGKNQAGTGAAIGYGVFSALSLLKPQKKSVGISAVYGGLTVGSLALAAAQIEKSNTSPTTPPKKDNTLLITGVGTLTGIVGGIAFHKKPKGGYSSGIRKKYFLSNTAITMTGNKVGIRVRL